MPSASPDRRTAFVTGATSGIGWETARLLGKQGCHVVVHARDYSSGEEAITQLDLAVADFSRLGEVRSMAQSVARHHPAVDILINNAAVAAPERHTITADGVELTFQVNFLAAYVLTRALKGPLTARAGSRVVNVSSSMHRTASISWNDINRTRR
ncbi:SDR family NAD(P)-dependent oxidoreductase [Streptomyces sp. H27-C3]|uniref:SDR family NAD(P)-dependent oxidoreductase n=1 Tax=Streptomyces sp. H27-C3 TaxID=3046305 RepID=UPI0032D8C0A1